MFASASGTWTVHDVARFLGGLELAALVVMAATMNVGAGLWGFSARRAQSTLVGHRAQRVVVATVLGAAAVGGAAHIVSWAFGFGALR
jgi:hypothetical protein